MKTLVFAGIAMAASLAQAVEWKNVDAEHHLGGRKASAGYLQGKVVMVVRWGAKCCKSRELLPRIEEIWQSFKQKPLVVVGGHCSDGGSADEAKEQVKEHKLSFSVYADAGLAAGEPPFEKTPYLYVVNEVGKFIYRGRDERIATQAIVTALTDMESPKSVKQWRRFLDYELDNLPCRGYLRLKEFHKQYPKDAADYLQKAKALLEIPNLKKVADLVAFAKKAKDPPVFGPKDRAKREKYQALVADVISKCEVFKEHPDPRVAQEAKNALADLKWTQATF